MDQLTLDKPDIKAETSSDNSVCPILDNPHCERQAANLNFEYALAIGWSRSQKKWMILQIATGNKTSVSLDLKSLVRTMSQDKIDSLILCHNHPVGDPSPSRNDIHTTRSIHQLCLTLSVNLTDHIIIGQETCFSFRAAGYL